MPTNRYFPNRNYRRTQRMVEDLVVESIKQTGIDVYYLPKTFVNRDTLFGEDALRKYTTAAQIEVYIKDVQGFQGQGDIFSKFGLEIRDQVTFVMARRRFEQMKSEKLQSEVGFNLVMEDTDVNQPSYDNMDPGTPNANTIGSFTLEAGTANGYTITTFRPNEGDLIFHPESTSLFEIKYVEHEIPFYQFGALFTYELTCQLMEYSSEKIDTGIPEIDRMEDAYTFDELNFEVTLEDGSGVLSFEDGGSFINEDFTIESGTSAANNSFFMPTNPEVAEVVDFTEDNPFSETI